MKSISWVNCYSCEWGHFCLVEERLVGSGGGLGARTYIFTRFRVWFKMACRPLGFLIGLPFMLVGLILSIIGMVLWILASIIVCICPCCLCLVPIPPLAVSLIKAPVSIMYWFTKQIPCWRATAAVGVARCYRFFRHAFVIFVRVKFQSSCWVKRDTPSVVLLVGF